MLDSTNKIIFLNVEVFSMNTGRFLFAALLVLVAAFSRILPHPANFSPVMAIALFSGVAFLSRKESLLVSLVAMIVSDFFIGFHDLMLVVYGCMVLMTAAGWYLKQDRTILKTVTIAFAGSLFFFIVTNFAVWLTSGMYALDFNGLVQCYMMAIPFYQNSIAGDVGYTVILFGALYAFERVQNKSQVVAG